jgi:hypothetical protein
LTYTFLTIPNGLLGFGLIPKKTGIKIDLFPAIIISFVINYSMLSNFETYESFYVIKKPFVSEYFNACFHIFLIFNARAIDSIVRECLLKANLQQVFLGNGWQPTSLQSYTAERSRAKMFLFSFVCIKE